MSLKIWLIAVLLLAAYVAPSWQEDQDPEEQEDIDADAPQEIEDDGEDVELSELDSEDPKRKPKYCSLYRGTCWYWCRKNWKRCNRVHNLCCVCNYCKGYFRSRKGDETEMNPAEENDVNIEDPSSKKCN